MVVSGSRGRKVEATRLCHSFGTYTISPLPWVKASHEASLDSTVGYRLHFSVGGDAMNCDHGFPTINGYQKVEFWHIDRHPHWTYTDIGLLNRLINLEKIGTNFLGMF